MSLIEEKIKKVLKKIKPQIQAHGGEVELVSVSKGKAKMKISGACLGCPYSEMTFNTGLREMIKAEVPELKEVEFVS